MISRARARSLPWLVAAALAAAPALARSQDTPLYRDPSPTDGPRIEGPLLPPRPPRPTPPPPPGGLGPFQPQDRADVAPEPPREPLLVVTPMPPPLPAFPAAMIGPDGDVKVRRKTTIRPPNGPLGRFHEWFRDALFGPPRPASSPARRVLERFHRDHVEWFHHDHEPTAAETPGRPFIWPTWPLASRP